MPRQDLYNGILQYNPWTGIAAANSVAQLDAMRKHGAIQRAMQVRTAAQILGVEEEDDMGDLAGRDIVHPQQANVGPWLFLTAALLAGLWVWSSRNPVVATPQPTVSVPLPAGPGTIDVEVIKGPK